MVRSSKSYGLENILDNLGFENLDTERKHAIVKRVELSNLDSKVYNEDIEDLRKLAGASYVEVETIGMLKDATRLVTSIGNISKNTFEDNRFSHSNIKSVIYSILTKEDGIEVVSEKQTGEQQSFHTKRYGYFEAINEGEFGGELYNYTKHGEELVAYGNYIAVHQVGYKIYAFKTLSHLGSESFAIEQITRHKDKYIITNIVKSDKQELSCFCILGLNIYFISNKMFYKLNTETDEITYIDYVEDCNTLTVYNDKAYIGSNYQLTEIDLNTKYKKYYTFLSKKDLENDWYIHNTKMIDIWNKIIYKGEN